MAASMRSTQSHSTNDKADWFTIRAVSQDEFEYVKVPDAPRQPTQSPEILSAAAPAPGINKPAGR